MNYFPTEYTTTVYVYKGQKQPIFQGCLRDVSPPEMEDDDPRNNDTEQPYSSTGSITHTILR